MNREELNRIISLVDASIAPTGCHCIEVEWESGSKTLRVFVDHPGGVGIDECVAVNGCLEDVPQIDEMIAGAYNLEVSSPGVERPLRLATHFREALGKVVEVKLVEQVDGRKHGSGKVLAVSDHGHVQVETARGTWEFPADLVLRASLKYDWTMAPTAH